MERSGTPWWRYSGALALATCGLLGAARMTLAATEPSVTIVGGLNREERLYVWTVTNGSAQAIGGLQVPHYRGGIFTPPKGWEFSITNQTELGMKDAPGLITARATPGAAIQPNRSGVFTLSFSADALTTPSKRTATITFLDGTTLQVAGVEVPWRKSWFERQALFLELGVMFGLFLLVQAIRGRRRRKREVAPAAAPPA